MVKRKTGTAAAKRDQLLNEAMKLLRPKAKQLGLSQEECLVEILSGRVQIARPLKPKPKG